AQACRPHSQRSPDRTSRQRKDLAARSAPLRGRRDESPGNGARRHDGLGLRARRAVAQDVDLAGAQLLRVGRAQDQPHRHARRAELRRRRAGRDARLRVGGLRRQRRHGRRGHDPAPVGARGGARPRADDLREHARPRARRLLSHAGVAEGRLRRPRRRDGDPDRLRARHQRCRRPRRHEGLPLRRRRARELHRDRDPRRHAGARRAVPR
ncbi:MAG: Translation elongation factor G-related protein, partial [uncultured Solirubrobacteraceae bacterium]